jgi:hypothetical protein
MAEALAGLGVAGKSPVQVIFLLLPYSSTHSASVIAVVQITEDVITKCSAYGVAYRNASKYMSRLSDQVSGLQRVLLDLNELIEAEQAQTSSRLPTLMSALDISHHNQTPGEPLEVTKGVEEAQPGYAFTETMPLSERTGILKRLLKNNKRKGGKNTTDTQREHTEGIHTPTATTGDSLVAESGNAAGNASESKDYHKSLSRVLRDCQDELQRLSKKLETKNMHAARTEALVYAFKQDEVNKTLDNLQKFQHQLVVALTIDQAYVQLPALGCL